MSALVSWRHETQGSVAVMVNDDDVLTYAALDERSRLLARRFLAAGINRSDRVALQMANGIDWAVTAVAIMRVGATLVPLSTLLRPREVEAQLRTAAVTALIVQPEYRTRRYLDELDDHLPGISDVGSSLLRHPRLANLRHVWA